MTDPNALFRGTVPGAGVIAGQILLRNTLARPDIDPNTKAVLFKQLSGILPGQVVAPGATSDQRTATPEDLAALIPSAAVSAAGLDPAMTPAPPPSVLWDNGSNQLLVRLGGVKVAVTAGVVEFTVPVSCDQTGDTAVTVAFVTGSTGRPTGGVTATEDRPRGDPVIVENWHEQLIAFAWNTLLIATSALSGAAGADRSGRTLISNAIIADSNGLSVLPMGRHPFAATDSMP